MASGLCVCEFSEICNCDEHVLYEATMKCTKSSFLDILCVLLCALSGTGALGAESADLKLTVEQVTFGPRHHFFGYIGQSLTVPWSGDGRYIVALRTAYHDHMPEPDDAAGVVLIDTERGNEVIRVDQSRAWNFQQGTMFYWNPASPCTQFFFNDRDPQTQQVFTVLYDIEHRRRVREYRFDDVPVANGGVCPKGGFFLAINYGRMARLRPVTGYPGVADPTAHVAAPENDGIFRVDVATGGRKLLVSFRQLRDLLRDKHERIDEVAFYINHSLCSRSGEIVYFYARARFGDEPMAVNAPCSLRTDGTGLMSHEYIGGHPEWAQDHRVIGQKGNRQVLYDVQKKEIVGQIATPEIIPSPGGDVAFSPDGKWFVNGYGSGGKNYYVIVRLSDGAYVRSQGFSRGPYVRGELRIDPAPRWNRTSDAVLVPCWTEDGTRQMFILRVQQNAANGSR